VLNIYLKNFYFDQEEYDEDPIKDYIDYFYFPLRSDTSPNQLLKVKKTTVELEDSWTGLSHESYDFFSYGVQYTYYTQFHKTFYSRPLFFAFWFIQNEQVDKINRRVYSLADIFSAAGGFSSSIIFLVTLLFTAIIKLKYYSRIASTLLFYEIPGEKVPEYLE